MALARASDSIAYRDGLVRSPVEVCGDAEGLQRPDHDVGVADRPADLERLGRPSERGRWSPCWSCRRRRLQRSSPATDRLPGTSSMQRGEQRSGPRCRTLRRPSRSTDPRQIAAPASASAGSDRQKSSALQTLARSTRIRSNASTCRASLAPATAASSMIQSRWRRRQDRLAHLPREPLAAELAKRFEEPEPVGAVALSALQDGLLDERPDELGDLLGVQAVAGTHRLRRVELEPAGEHRTGGAHSSRSARSGAGSSSRSRPRASAAGATGCGRRCPTPRAGRRVHDRARRGRGT